MAILSLLPLQLFFRNNRDYGVGSITFDLILTENHNFSNEVTQYNVENGSVISDHIRNNLENGSLSGLISNFTLRKYGLFTNRAQDAFDEFVRLWKEKTLVTIVTVMRVYDDVAITNVSVDRSGDTGEAIVLNVSFQKVKQVSLKAVLIDVAVNIKNMKSKINRQSAPPANIGRTVGG